MKRFFARETALLMLPVVAVGALGLWLSNRAPAPEAARDADALRLKFRIDKPTALEAFRGANVAFVIESEGYDNKHYESPQMTPYLEVQTPRGKQVSWKNRGSVQRWGNGVWNYTAQNHRTTRFLLDTRAVPAGTLHFGCYGIAQPNFPGVTARLKPLRGSGKWKVDRAQIKPLNLATWPRHPLVSLREVVVTRKIAGNPRGGTSDTVTGEAIFELNGAAMNQQSAFAVDFSNQARPVRGVTYGMGNSTGSAKDTVRRRVREWMVDSSPFGRTSQARVSGRVSAANRWPLGFQFEPFSFQAVKVGQKLKFKQFPVALPPNARP